MRLHSWLARSGVRVALSGAAGALLALACTPKVMSVDVAPKETLIKAELDVKPLTATAKDKDGKDIDLGDKKPTWSSSDPAVAVVDSEGKVKPAGSGKAVVTAKIDEAEGKANVTVTLLKGIKLESPAVVIKLGTPHAPLKVAFTNEKGEIIDKKDAKVEWKTADPNIATVGPDGTISGVNAGSTTVTCKVDGLSTDLAVTVNPAESAGGDAGPASPGPGTKAP